MRQYFRRTLYKRSPTLVRLPRRRNHSKLKAPLLLGFDDSAKTGDIFMLIEEWRLFLCDTFPVQIYAPDPSAVAVCRSKIRMFFSSSNNSLRLISSSNFRVIVLPRPRFPFAHCVLRLDLTSAKCVLLSLCNPKACKFLPVLYLEYSWKNILILSNANRVHCGLTHLIVSAMIHWSHCCRPLCLFGLIRLILHPDRVGNNLVTISSVFR